MAFLHCLDNSDNMVEWHVIDMASSSQFNHNNIQQDFGIEADVNFSRKQKLGTEFDLKYT